LLHGVASACCCCGMLHVAHARCCLTCSRACAYLGPSSWAMAALNLSRFPRSCASSSATWETTGR
jgi:hypothetical protein